MNTIIEDYKKNCLNAGSEDDIKAASNIFISEIAKQYNLSINAHSERTSIHGGRADSVYNDIYFEFKKKGYFRQKGIKGIEEALYGRNNSDHGLKHYLINFSLQECNGSPELFEQLVLGKVGVAFDGEQFVFCRYKRCKKLNSLFDNRKTVNIQHGFPQEFMLEFSVLPICDFDNGIKRLLLYVHSTHKKVLNSVNLCDTFSSSTQITKDTIKYLYEHLVASLKINRRVETLYNEWDRIFGVIYEKQESDFVKHVSAILSIYPVTSSAALDVKKALFVIQTYYSIIVKLLIQNLYVTLKYPTSKVSAIRDKSDLMGLFHGDMDNFNDYIDNFFEIHFFEWFTLTIDFDINYINEILIKIDEFETAASVIKPEIVSDVLKKTYESLMPKDLRHLMGEYYTPEWLVDFTIDKSGYTYEKDGTVLDPTCGSCAFLTHLIKGYSEKFSSEFSYQQLVEHIITNFVGFDINPIAVIQGKGNYILSLGDITQLESPVSIPVYMCDSILVPTVHAKQVSNKNSISIHTIVGDFVLPILKNRKDNDVYLRTLSKCILSDYTIYETFKERLLNESHITLSNEEDRISRSLFCKLLNYHHAGQDGFWPIILKNSFAPLFCKHQFDYVMGNPPWIAWKAMSESYRDLTLDIWLSYGIFEKNAYDKITSHDDFAMAVTYVAIDHYLKEHGKAALILPQTFVKSSKGGEGFRKFCITREGQQVDFCIQKVYDMLRINPFKGIASNKTSVYIFCKNEKMNYPMDYYMECELKKGEAILPNDDYISAESKMVYHRLSAKPINSNDDRSPWLTLEIGIMHHLNHYLGPSAYKGRKGIEPCGAKGIYLINIRRETRNLIEIENLIERSRLQEALDRGVHIGSIEKDFVYPMVGGRNIDKWGINSHLYMLVPHYSTGGALYRGVPEADLQANYYRTYDWLYYFHDLLLSTRIKSAKFFDATAFPWYRLDNVGDYTFSPYKVVWQEQSHSVNCCVLSEINDPFVGNKPFVTDSKVLMVSLYSKEEAHYLCAVLNSENIEKIIQGYTINTNRGVDVVKNIKVPKFDPKNQDHIQLFRASEEAHLAYLAKDYDSIAKAETTINSIVPRIFCK